MLLNLEYGMTDGWHDAIALKCTLSKGECSLAVFADHTETLQYVLHTCWKTQIPPTYGVSMCVSQWF